MIVPAGPYKHLCDPCQCLNVPLARLEILVRRTLFFYLGDFRCFLSAEILSKHASSVLEYSLVRILQLSMNSDEFGFSVFEPVWRHGRSPQAKLTNRKTEDFNNSFSKSKTFLKSRRRHVYQTFYSLFFLRGKEICQPLRRNSEETKGR